MEVQPGPRTRQLAEAYVGGCWEQLASYAWRRYLEFGHRGAVAIPWCAIEAAALGNLIAFPLAYIVSVPDQVVVQSCIAEYDPERQIVVLFLGDADVSDWTKNDSDVERGKLVESSLQGSGAVWIFDGHVSPPAAAARRGN